MANTPSPADPQTTVDGVTVESITHHRNGIGGEPFLAAIVEWPAAGAEYGISTKFVATAPSPSPDGKTPKQARDEVIYGTRVLNISLLADGEVGFGRNSWRGEKVGPAVAEAWHAVCINDPIYSSDPFGCGHEKKDVR